MQRFISVIEDLAAAKHWLRHRNLEVHRLSRYMTLPGLGGSRRQPFVACAPGQKYPFAESRTEDFWLHEPAVPDPGSPAR
jgi:hypothetical protein